MPRKPATKNLQATSVEVLNTIRANATESYQNLVPQALGTTESIKEIGSIIMSLPTLQNEFLNALVNRIGRVMVTSKMYDNPLSKFKKGMLEFGETVEEIFVNIAKPFQFNPEQSETTLFKREIPDVRSTFHIMNYQKFYKATVSNDQLRQAFLSWQGITDLIAKIVDAMYTGANYDEFITMKYLLAKHILKGNLYPVEIPEATPQNAKEIVTVIKGISNSMEFLSSKYNLAGVKNNSVKNDQYMLINSLFDSIMDVEVLASAFNMDKAEFLGHRTLIDNFGELDKERLAILFENDPSYTEISDEELKALNTIPAVIVDKDWFMVFDNFYNFTEQYNGEGLYWNYFYHTWKTFSISPFANNAVMVSGTPEIVSVNVTPATASVVKGNSISLKAVVVNKFFANKSVTWSLNSSISTIDSNGVVQVSPNETEQTLTVTATSIFDPTKTGTAILTIIE